ncbi:MAG TPA: matrixin family metalloprotease, partial [Anaerolineales bacterium]
MRRSFNRMTPMLLLISSLMLACSLTVPNVPSSQPGYRFDELPNKVDESSAIAEYRTISAWDKSNITYAFAGGTDQLPGDTEFDVVSRAFALWDDQIPLTFT